jgi:hypothetical protein
MARAGHWAAEGVESAVRAVPGKPEQAISELDCSLSYIDQTLKVPK